MNLAQASVKHVEDCVESGYASLLGSLRDPSVYATHILDDICWHELTKHEVQPFLDIVPIDLNQPNNLVLLLPPFNHEQIKD